MPDVSTLPSDSTASPAAKPESTFLSGLEDFTFYDIFFWRDAPDWYRKTFLSTGFGLSYCALKQYMSRHELEVFMPPRSKILPQSLSEGYQNSQRLKYGFLKVGKEATTIAGTAATYYAGAFYLGEYRGVHSWENFAASGAVAGMGLSWYMLTPFKLRATIFGGCLGAGMGALGAWSTLAAGYPLWDMSHDFEGYMFGRRLNLREDDAEVYPAESMMSGVDGTNSSSGSSSSVVGTSGSRSSGGGIGGSSSSSSSRLGSDSKSIIAGSLGGGVTGSVTSGTGNSNSNSSESLAPVQSKPAPWSTMFTWLKK